MNMKRIPAPGISRSVSRLVWKHPTLGGPCIVHETRTVEVKALDNPPQLHFFLPRKGRRPFLITVLRRYPAGPWLPPSEAFTPVPGYQSHRRSQIVQMEPGTWVAGRELAEKAARNQGLPPSLIGDIYPKKEAPNVSALKNKYPAWPVVGAIPLHVAIRQSRGRRSLVLLSGSKNAPVIVATAEKPLNPAAYTPAPPALVWTAGSGRRPGILNFSFGPHQYPRTRSDARDLFRSLGLDAGILNTII